MTSGNGRRRQTGIEVMRIWAALMIVASHFSLHGIIRNGYLAQGNLFNALFATFLVQGNIGVGVFFAITGLFSRGDRRGVSRKLLADVAFFCLLNIALLAGAHALGLSGEKGIRELAISALRFVLIPITGKNWWFITAYIVLVLFIAPVVDGLDARASDSGRRIIILLLLAGSVVSEYFGTAANRYFQAAAYYLLGKEVRHAWDAGRIRRTRSALLGMSIAGLVLHGGLMYMMYMAPVPGSYLISNVLATLLVCPALAACLLEAVLKDDRRRSRAGRARIGALAGCALGIYMLHDSPVTRELLWKVLLPMERIYRSNLFALWALLCILSIFAAGALVSAVNHKWFRPAFLRGLDQIERRVRRTFVVEGNKS